MLPHVVQKRWKTKFCSSFLNSILKLTDPEPQVQYWSEEKNDYQVKFCSWCMKKCLDKTSCILYWNIDLAVKYRWVFRFRRKHYQPSSAEKQKIKWKQKQTRKLNPNCLKMLASVHQTELPKLNFFLQWVRLDKFCEMKM